MAENLWNVFCRTFFFALLVLSLPVSAVQESPQTFTYQGRMMDSSGTSPITGVTYVVLTIMDPSATCILYEEIQSNVNLGSNGLFALDVGSIPGVLKRTSNDAGLSMAQVFANGGVQIRAPGAGCASGYTPSSGDARVLRVNAGGVTLSPNLVITSVPNATVAETLQGIGPSGFIRVTATITQGAIDTLTNNGEASGLHNHDLHNDGRYARIGYGSSQNFGSGNLYTTGKIGIGTTTPAAGTDIDIKNTDPVIRLTTNTTGVPKLEFYSSAGTTVRSSIEGSGSNNTLTFKTGGTQAMQLDANQNAAFAGSVSIAGTLGLGKYTTANENTPTTGLIAILTGLGAAAKGTTWVNTTTNTVRYWDGSAAQSLGTSSAWTISGSDIYRGTGNVGVGTNAPQTTFHVQSADQNWGGTMFENTYTGSEGTFSTMQNLRDVSSVGGGVGFGLSMRDVGNSIKEYGYIGAVIEDNSSNNSGSVLFAPRKNGTRTEAMRILSNGNIGIGTTAMPDRVNIVSGDNTVGMTSSGLTLQSDSTIGYGTQTFSMGTSKTLGYSYLQSISQSIGFSDLLVQPLGGKVGIGTQTPAATLDVNGTMRLAKNTAEPFACDATHDGTMALTNRYTTCVCRNGSGWVLTFDGSSNCVWDTGGDLVTDGNGRHWADGSYAASCDEYRHPGTGYAYSGDTGDGTYRLDIDGIGGYAPFDASCDMTTDGGGWTLVLNYLHQGGTNPSLIVRTTNLPIQNSNVLGDDEGGTTAWGHASTGILNVITFSSLRMYCKTTGHSRVVHFKTSLAGALSYIKTGTGSFANIESNYTGMSGHTGYLPALQDGMYTTQGNSALTEFPFYTNGLYHWGIQGQGNRWECDDYTGANSTLHRAWVK